VVIAVDTGGYVFGHLFGGPRLARRISPAKTWVGLAGAMLSAALASFAFGLAWPAIPAAELIFAGVGLALAAQAGDLFESAVKRRFGVKDSSGLIPGHGGLLDRCDGLIAGIVVVAFAMIGREVWT